MVHFYEFLKTCSWRSNSVTRQVSLNRTKIDTWKIEKLKCDILGDFQKLCFFDYKMCVINEKNQMKEIAEGDELQVNK